MPKVAERYHKAEIFWVQEEHKNQGAWAYVQPRFLTAFKGTKNIRLIFHLSFFNKNKKLLVFNTIQTCLKLIFLPYFLDSLEGQLRLHQQQVAKLNLKKNLRNLWMTLLVCDSIDVNLFYNNKTKSSVLFKNVSFIFYK